ncbi:Crp/Fnr family transcriptional regulator [Amorphus orientalis]|uniref:CRP-like cAMP-binding protein n=1 Tax=Amorphus orientalis TaxID=649198 RepID=A0AAE3VMU2_9HYPH|nr:Crp/Fnr family transcriptional regulator [Amorphus orientalis]MDQ0315019.1 CRP-like cAMP-binding protein [Amorphus orientalis]
MPTLDRSLIRDLPSFRGLEADDLDLILSRAWSAHYPAGSEVFGQGEENRSFFLLLSGHLRVVKTSPDGHQVIARYINEGELFGIGVALGMPTYPASAVAAVDSVALAWPNGFWNELQSRLPSVGHAAYETIGARLQETQARVVEASTEQVEQRVAHTLLRLVNQSGRKIADGIEIDFPITRQDIAEMTGTTLHTVSRLLSAWEDEGLVRSARKKVVVTDAHGLLLIAEARKKG